MAELISESEMMLTTIQNLHSLLVKDFKNWDCAYFRFHKVQGRYGTKASIDIKNSVKLLSPFEYEAYYDLLNDRAPKLVEEFSDNKPKVLLFRIYGNGEYTLNLEYSDSLRWNITKSNGETGIPGDIPIHNKKMLQQPKTPLLRKVGLGLKFASALFRRKS